MPRASASLPATLRRFFEEGKPQEQHLAGKCKTLQGDSSIWDAAQVMDITSWLILSESLVNKHTNVTQLADNV